MGIPILNRRKVFLGDHPIYLTGSKPKKGTQIHSNFYAIPARKAKTELKKRDLSRGLVIVSTLPNIHSFACSQQVLDLELETKKLYPKARIFHIACDPKSGWEEVEKLHPFLESPGYTIHGVGKKEADSFKNSFGVGVEGNRRIAHGLFALQNGKFMVSYIPRQQYGIPNIKKFLKQVQAALLDSNHIL
jgi:peroxiredoxin